jgi:hypothetical protein
MWHCVCPCGVVIPLPLAKHLVAFLHNTRPRISSEYSVEPTLAEQRIRGDLARPDPPSRRLAGRGSAVPFHWSCRFLIHRRSLSNQNGSHCGTLSPHALASGIAHSIIAIAHWHGHSSRPPAIGPSTGDETTYATYFALSLCCAERIPPGTCRLPWLNSGDRLASEPQGDLPPHAPFSEVSSESWPIALQHFRHPALTAPHSFCHLPVCRPLSLDIITARACLRRHESPERCDGPLNGVMAVAIPQLRSPNKGSCTRGRRSCNASQSTTLVRIQSRRPPASSSNRNP